MKDHQKHLEALDAYLTLKNFSKATRSAYRCALRQFLVYRQQQGMTGDFGQEQARQYILYRYSQGLKWQTINGDYSAMYKFYRYVLDLEWDVKHIPRPRKERSLPSILSQQEIQKVIEHGDTFRYQVFMTLLYGTGMRLSEALNLRLVDIDGHRLQIHIVRGKGAKDRYINIPECLLDLLRDYYKAYRPQELLFNGRSKGLQWSTRAAQICIQKARIAAGIGRRVTPHVFRHCYATHHLENGTNLIFLRDQMGHKHLKTTAKYIRLCKTYPIKVQHPLASMDITWGQTIP
jgi:site-specific recombinase XerD